MASAASAPFHVLLLAGGNRRPPPKEGESAPAEIDDYLSRRAAFRKKKALRSGARAAQDDAPLADGGEGVAVDIAKLQGLASRLELAVAACCERAPSDSEVHDGDGEGRGPSSPTSAAQHHSRSRLHRPLFPSNYVAPDPSAEPDASTSSSQIKIEEANKPKGPTKGGILRSGKEGHFAKLLFMYFPKQSVGHRALAVAILQRTVDWEKSDKTVGPGEERYRRTKSFLAAGGMKLLSRWLVDAYTTVPAPSSPEKKGSARLVPQVASPTGCLLLPILKLLKAIPFDKDIVVDSGINKTIRRLKKALGKLVERLEPGALHTATHAIAGGLPVRKVLAATESVMSLWTEAAKADPSGEDIRLAHDPFREMREKVLTRFGGLTQYLAKGGTPPEWMPEAIVGMRVLHASQLQQSPSPPKIDRESEEKVDHLPDIQARAGQNTRTMDGMFQPRKRKNLGLAEMLEPIKKSSKKVSWTDRPLGGNALPKPLREERVFVKEAEEAPATEIAMEHGNADGAGEMEIPDELLADAETTEQVEVPDELLVDAGSQRLAEDIPDELLADPDTSEEVAIPDELLADAGAEGEENNQVEDDSDDDIMEDLF
ncbi:hypothetical protein ACHAXT_002800 [Thalassiosira profunda]